MPTHQPTETLAEILHRVFGHRDFRPHQRPVCEAAASGRDVLLVMPTGAGKSLCYQLPALARRSHAQPNQPAGTALVISPLIALMDDQASKLTALGLSVARIHSGLSRDDARQACREYLSGALDFLFIAPERMRVPGFPEMLARRKPSLIAIDEAHCISAWGHDFRPDYRTLGQFLPALRPSPIIALTATATPTVQRDIALQLDLQNPAIFITGFRRHNLAIQAVELSKPQRPDFTLKLLQAPDARPAIVYAGSRKDAEEFASKLHKHFPTAAYHAGLDPGTRERVQRAFLSGKLDVVVATVAFGMGVDKADIRTVVHVALPGSVEAFYQEIGRAGRDGLPSRTVLLHGFADRRLQEFLLEKSYPPTSDLERVALTLPADFAAVDVLHNALRKKKDMIDRDTLDRTLEKLLVAGVAEMDINGDIRRSDNSTSGVRWQAAYESQIAVRRAQIDCMIAFAESNTCRMAALVRHFGDTSDTTASCGLCDICNPSDRSAAQAAHQPTAQERTWLRQILSALESRSTSTGKLFTDLRLKTDKRQSPQEARNDFDHLLDGLARAGLITLANESFLSPEGREITYRKASITHEGRTPDEATLDTVWLRSSIPESDARKRSTSRSSTNEAREATQARPQRTRVDAHTPADAAPLSGAAEALLAQLRNWRTELARPTKTPAFLILSDAVLRAIAQHAPQNITALHAISGMGQSKVDRFGADLIAICREFARHGSAKVAASAVPPDGGQSTSPSDTDAAHKKPALASDAKRSRKTQNVSAQRSTLAQDRPPLSEDAGASSIRISAVQQNKRQIAPPAAHELTTAQLAMETRLKDWRREAARAAGLPTFFILSDTQLRSIACRAPRSMSDLSSIRGLTSDKVERFGSTLLDLCHSSAT